MKSEELREKFLKFFEKKGHKILPSSSLIPENDPSVLLTTAGMQQFKKWFAGFEKPAYSRVATIQKCVRVDDIDEVGDDTHFSFFEMLGNFSFGGLPESSSVEAGYFKEEAIKWGIEFIRDELDIDFGRMSFTYFSGDEKTPADTDSLKILKLLDIPDEKITAMGREDNFWGPTGDEGPCGPTVEIYVDGVEVWNLVFNEFLMTRDGKYISLETKGIDTGAGLERVLAVINGKKSVYETDIFEGILLRVRPLAKVRDQHSERVIADHLRTATFLLADNVTPSNLDKGYITRRLIRRAIRHGRVLGIEQGFCSKIAEVVIDQFKDSYPELLKNKESILAELEKEEGKFKEALEKGLKEFQKRMNLSIEEMEKESQDITWRKRRKILSGEDAFYIFQTFGFPLEMMIELAEEQGNSIDNLGFEEEFQKHQELSREGAEKKFKGGLASGGEMETKYHTVSHLLHQALKMVLGDHVKQAGSNITAERARFDFSHPEKMTPEEITEVESIVNDEIEKGLEVKCEEMSLDEANKSGAIGIFDHKYGDSVKVYSIGNFSREVCGGPHVKNTSELGYFKITKEESSSAGVRRIKAILE